MKIKNQISAREANKLADPAGETKQKYQETMEDIYNNIREQANNGDTSLDYLVKDFNLANMVFHELTIQGYNTYFANVSDALTEQYRVDVDWKNVDPDPNTEYILPIEDTILSNAFSAYAHKNVNDEWQIDYEKGDKEALHRGFTVTAKDIEEAPDWVKAIEPIAVKDVLNDESNLS